MKTKMMSRSYCLLLLLSACFSFASAAAGEPCHADPEVGQKVRRYTGAYRNGAFNFAARIPAGLTGFDTDDPDYQRGFMILLPRDEATVLMWGEVNSLEFAGTREAAKFDLKALGETAWRVLPPQYAPVSLDGHRDQALC